jgi:hypothetical protein
VFLFLNNFSDNVKIFGIGPVEVKNLFPGRVSLLAALRYKLKMWKRDPLATGELMPSAHP